MKYAVTILAAATGALAQSSPWGGAWNGTSVAYTTIVTTAITTYCSGATQLTYGDRTYTVTEATTLTITDCPCTLTQPIYTPTPSTVLYTSCPPGAASTEAPAAPSVSTPVNNALAYSNPLTISYATPTVTFKPNGGFATGTGVYPTKTASYSGAANANSVTGLFVGAVAGVVAMAL